MTPDEEPQSAEPPGSASAVPETPPDDGPSRTEAEHDVPELLDAIGAAAGSPLSFVYAPQGNFNSGAVHGGQRVHNGPVNEGQEPRQGTVREGPVPEAEVQAAAFGFARPDWFGEAFAELKDGPLFLAGRPGSGRRTVALNLLRERCGEGSLVVALDSVTELDRWRPTDPSARGYLVDGLFPSRPLGPGVLGHVRSLLEKAKAHMVIILPDDAALLRRLEQDLHVRPMHCVPPPPAMVFGGYFEKVVPDQRERERLLSALNRRHELSDLLVPELVPAEVVELVTAIVTADGDPDALGDLGDRLSYRAEQEVPELMRELRGDPDALAFLLAASVYEGLDHRLVREEATRLLKLSEGRLTAELPPTGASGADKSGRPNPDFVFRRSLTDLLHIVRAVRQQRAISTEGAYAHTVQGVVFVRHRQAEAVLRHVWREYGQLSDLLVEWLREVERTTELTRPVGQFMGRAARWGGGRRALRHIQALAESDRTTSRLIAANALGIAAEDPVLVAEVRYRLQRWSLAAGVPLRTTVAYACGAEFGLSRPDLALRLLHDLLLGVRSRPGEKGQDDDGKVLLAVRVALLSLFQAGNEAKVFGRLVEWLDAERCDAEQVLSLFGQLLQFPAWFMRRLADETPEAESIVEIVRRALNTERSFDVTCSALLRWADWARWDETQFRAVEKLFTALARAMQFGEFGLFVEMDETGADGWAGLNTARASLSRWRAGERGEAA
ncbi:hypothetical protein OG349_16890 [Streptomyces sp. NBC_01317]|uniref:hypothetical protein n=1 Tax=Streptomyces sp. NBC_01317 TaxID=2903822 RepID=UPI002E15F896|nr:hypothetical protein OG349_16890 [Streptomyces sp. NBC_01317]